MLPKEPWWPGLLSCLGGHRASRERELDSHLRIYGIEGEAGRRREGFTRILKSSRRREMYSIGHAPQIQIHQFKHYFGCIHLVGPQGETDTAKPTQRNRHSESDTAKAPLRPAPLVPPIVATVLLLLETMGAQTVVSNCWKQCRFTVYVTLGQGKSHL